MTYEPPKCRCGEEAPLFKDQEAEEEEERDHVLDPVTVPS